MLRVRRFTKFRIRPAVYRDTRPTRITAWTVGGEPVPFADAVTKPYLPFALGEPWGRPWDTTWFDVSGEVPADWAAGGQAELVVDLGFTGDQPGFQAEGLVYRPDGEIVKAIEPYNSWVPLPDHGPFRLLIEAAANPIVQVPYEYEPTAMGDKATAGDEPLYRLTDLSVAWRDQEVWELLQDVTTLDGLVDVLPEQGARRAEIVHALERMVDVMDPDDVAGTAARGREVLAPVLAGRAPDSSLIVSAVGHAHIDCAWLWPTRETVRKVARTFANVLDLSERHPEFVFAASSAQQYAWLKDSQPRLFERVRHAVAAGVIRPVGGMWVESDTNMPGGEALARQFVLGKRFFAEEFGVDSEEVWLPDSFGYTAALPQIARAAGARYFLTQKPSWNETNPMPHSSFLWEGIDGSRVFTHFPPAETYNSDLGAADLARTERTFRQKGKARHVLGLYGWGDGGGGPTREMLAAAERKHDLDGSPRVRLADPGSFFRAAEAELSAPPVWVGEMYLELHRATLISQARSKRGNRHSEALLREAELWAATAAVRRGAPYPYDELRRIWETVLLLQFHDILPGTSIAWVHQDAERDYGRVADELTALITTALDALRADADDALVAANAGPYPRHGVPAMGLGPATPAATATPRPAGDRIVLDDGMLHVEIDRSGTLVSVVDLDADRELLPQGVAGGVLQLFRDTPREWDAWDINDEDKRSGRDLVEPMSIDIVDDAVVVRHERGKTVINVSIRLSEGKIDYTFDIDWHESQKLLKLAFPLDIRTDRSTSEIQFGHLHRPIHQNTSWDAARFETVAHRWIHVGEPDYGVAIANDVVYGHDIRGGQAPSGRPMTTARLSLLRAPRYPDPFADQGRHAFSVSLRPGGIPEAIADGYALHLPLRTVPGAAAEPLLVVTDRAVVVESVKLAEDRSGDLVVRLYEAHGKRSRATVRTRFGWHEAVATDLLERAVDSEAVRGTTPGSGVELELRPFELLTLRFRDPVA
ncbi:glycoside hydrolase family 38 C-terminal domain-containing protein [Streptomyces luomodiensis]|uniref:Glycoside hydrolase family 38 C-terminal domain-containing protein n=1 Tax=Streptomyces luomodiensis TaxID=3026192 RepID=A0ABY9VIS4_9ACTN|nr:glycoside hydrolase family 38 C-terminal domain-containing protein [Streptomyces sp. SCA4-21]WNF01860.1 glycoside hydrolase family 38 C-terminal domain-containing protein [Streptomyces sp. SCA4-21]